MAKKKGGKVTVTLQNGRKVKLPRNALIVVNGKVIRAGEYTGKAPVRYATKAEKARYNREKVERKDAKALRKEVPAGYLHMLDPALLPHRDVLQSDDTARKDATGRRRRRRPYTQAEQEAEIERFRSLANRSGRVRYQGPTDLDPDGRRKRKIARDWQEEMYDVPPGYYGIHESGGIIRPRYKETDALKPAAEGWSSERIWQLQSELVAAGLLVGAFTPGVWDAASQEAYLALLGHANRNLQGEGQALKELKTAYGRAKEAMAQQLPEFEPEPYEAPDPDELAQAIKEVFRQRLQREPTKQEIDFYSALMERDFRRNYNINTELSRRKYEFEKQKALSQMTEAEAIVAGETGGSSTPQLDLPDSYVMEDPESAFLRAFDERHRSEMEMLEQREYDKESYSAQQQGFALMRRLMSMG